MLPTVPYSTLGAPSITPGAPWGTQYHSQGTLGAPSITLWAPWGHPVSLPGHPTSLSGHPHLSFCSWGCFSVLSHSLPRTHLPLESSPLPACGIPVAPPVTPYFFSHPGWGTPAGIGGTQAAKQLGAREL